jgi:DNA (cytosine-5)-methyltransferase 1
VDLHSPTILSLCTGIGGLDLGIKLALPKVRTICYMEREAYNASILVSRIQDGSLDEAPIWSDLTTFDGQPWYKRVSILTAGFPCQPWSNAGKKKGTDDKRWIWPSIAKIIFQVRPPVVFLENVPGLVHKGLRHVLGTLAAAGYDAEWYVFSAAECGAAIQRNRLFILATMVGSNRVLRNVNFPSKNSRESSVSSKPVDLKQGKDIFIPGPSWKGWKKFLKREPDFKPTLRGVGYGVSTKMDGDKPANWESKVRAVGNSVQPITAALAFTVLSGRFLEE